MTTIKLIMLDMDGTLLTSDKQVTKNTIEALKRMKQQGVKIGLATGRPYKTLYQTLEKYQLSDIIDYAVSLNGVEIVDFHTQTIQQTHLLSAESVKEIAEKLDNIDGNVIVYDDECRYVKRIDERQKLMEKNFGYRLVEYDFSKNDREWRKVLVTSYAEAFTSEQFAYLNSLKTAEYHGFESAPFCFEMVHANVSKPNGIRVLCERLNITMDEVMAFGDSGNDVDMLKAVGVGVVMANGTNDAKSQGVKIGLASGRAKSLLDRTIEQYHLEDIVDYAVGVNGVQIIDFKNNVVKETYHLTLDMIQEVVEKLKDFPGNIVVYDDKCRYVKYLSEREKVNAVRNGTNIEVYDFEKNTREWPKFLILTDNESFTDDEFAFLYSLNNDRYYGFETAPYGFEIVDRRVSKSKGIAMLCEYLGISMDEVIAFGDSGNDVDMLEAVGLGVAMGNANDAARKAAKDVTLSNEEDGIAYYLNRYFKRGTL